jgi:PAS domain S-box-containing protein
MVHGYEPSELTGKHISVLVPKDRVAAMERYLKEIDRKGYLDSREIIQIRKDGSEVPMMMSGVAIKNNVGATERIALNAIDISEQRQLKEENILLEKHLRNQQRLETIGMLAGGVAHEINNPINGIMNYSQLILDTSGEYGEVKGYAGRIMEETKRVIMIIRNMLRFARQQDTEHTLVNVSDIVEQALSLARTVIKNDNIEIAVEIDGHIPPISCNDQQIQQILMNLITNARDALNEKYGVYDDNKKITISCATLKKDDGDYMRITVKDTGDGIPPEVRDNIFKPFFTTKGSGEGTGLGLSISRNIAKEHKGELSFETETGEHTEFHLDLPL